MKIMFKKIFCLLLSIICAVCAVGIPVFADEVEQESVIEAMEALRVLGIIPDYYDYNVELTKEVSRAEFVDAVAKLICTNSYQGDTPHFYDVPLSHWAFSSIGSLTELNILNGNGNRLFYPEETILIPEAYKIILSAMGYGDYASYVGGYPMGYVRTATRVGITEGISGTEKMTNKDMFLLLYQAMNTYIYEGIEYSDDGSVSYVVSNHTLLSAYHNIYMTTGVVNGVNCMSLLQDFLDNKNEVQIGNVIYESEEDLSSYLGEEVEVFYFWDKSADKKHIRWIKKTGRSKSLEITIDNPGSFDVNDFRLKYYDKNGNVKHVDFSRNGTLVYNGGVISSNIDTYLNHQYYKLKLVASMGDEYNVAIMREYENFVVNFKDEHNLRVFDKFNQELNLTPEEYLYLSIKDTSSVELSFDKIEVGSILSVYQSADLDYIEVCISNDSVKGIIGSMYERTTGYDLVVGENTYFYPKSNGTLSVRVGDNVILYLDTDGRIAYISEEDNTMKAAYLIDVSNKSNNPFSKKLSLKVLHQDGTIKMLECTENVTIDGFLYKDLSKVYNALLDIDGNIKKQLILIDVNDKNEISAIDTEELGEEGLNSLQVNVSRANKLWTRTLAGDGRMPINASTIIFVIPPVGATDVTEDDYMVLPNSATPSTKTLYATSYKTKEKVGCEQYVVLEWDPTNVEFTQMPILVEEVIMALDTEGREVKRIVGYQGKTAVNIEIDEDIKYSNSSEILSAGSLIHAIIGQNGKVIACDEYTNPMRAAAAEKLYDKITQISDVLCGDVIDVVDGVIKVDARESLDNDVRINCAAATVLVWDSEKYSNHIRVGSIADVLQGDYVAIELNYINPRLVVVYK